jgi:hypothetical protein
VSEHANDVVAPTFNEAMATAADVLRQARESIGMESSQRLIGLADSWLAMASLLTRADAD